MAARRRGLVFAGPRHELGRERRDAAVQLTPFQAHVLDQEPCAGAQGRPRLARVVQNPGQVLLERSPSLRHHYAALQEHGADLVDQRCPLADQAATGPDLTPVFSAS